jgi:Toprim domain
VKPGFALRLEDLRRLNAGGGEITDVACPNCGPDCRSDVNKRRKVLRIWDDGSFVTYACARCEITGWAQGKAGAGTATPRNTSPAAQKKDRIPLVRMLWSMSYPLRGSLAEVYLRHRGCFIDSPSLRFLPARAQHPPTMIARFEAEPLTGIHLTKLAPDGRGKAGSEVDKITIGPTLGQAIIVHDNPERGELAVSEGIEDAASIAVATGWPARAAGSAARIPHVIARAGNFERVYLAFDDDKAGRRALEKSRAVRPDIVPINFSKILAYREKMDANGAYAKFGEAALLASIEWSDARARYVAKEIGFEEMQRRTERARQVFSSLDEEPHP